MQGQRSAERRVIALVDHEKESTDFILAFFRKLKLNSAPDRKTLTEAFEIVPVIVALGEDMPERVRIAIDERCSGRRPDLVLVDLAFGSHEADSSVDDGRDLARALKSVLASTPVGVYTKHELGQFHRAQLTSDGLAVVLEQIATSKIGTQRMTGDQWSYLFDKVMPHHVAEEVAPITTPQIAVARFDSVGNTFNSFATGVSGSATALSSQQIKSAMQPNHWHGLYVVGCFDKQITFYSQQCRALTLLRALFEEGDLQAGQRVGVVGAGAAGLTAAIAAVRKGCQVDLYEERDSVLSIQSESTHRYLHPHIYEWPNDGCLQANAGLPFLDWSANYANKIVEDLQLETDRFARKHSSCFRIHTGARISKIIKTQQHSERIRLIGNDGVIDEHFHVVIMTVGYGLDGKTSFGVETPAYWSPDPIQGVHGQSNLKVLISGTGDGGLIDVARASLKKFRHDLMVQDISELTDIGRKMKQIDDTARLEMSRGHFDFNLRKMYDGLFENAELIERVKTLRRSDTEVTINVREPGVFSLETSLINRILVMLLLKAGVVRQKLGNIFEKDVIVQESGRRYRVAFNSERDESGDSDFDRVILRHGPSLDYFAKRFPEVSADCADLKGKLADLRLTGGLSEDTLRWYQ